MQLRHGALAIDLPPSWADQSTLLFVKQESALALPTPARETGGTEAVSVMFVSDVTPDEALARQAAHLQAVDPRFQIVARGAIDGALGRGATYLQNVAFDGRQVTQLVAAWQVGATVVLATAASASERYSHHAKELTGILASMRTVTP